MVQMNSRDLLSLTANLIAEANWKTAPKLHRMLECKHLFQLLFVKNSNTVISHGKMVAALVAAHARQPCIFGATLPAVGCAQISVAIRCGAAKWRHVKQGSSALQVLLSKASDAQTAQLNEVLGMIRLEAPPSMLAARTRSSDDMARDMLSPNSNAGSDDFSSGPSPIADLPAVVKFELPRSSAIVVADTDTAEGPALQVPLWEGQGAQTAARKRSSDDMARDTLSPGSPDRRQDSASWGSPAESFAVKAELARSSFAEELFMATRVADAADPSQLEWVSLPDISAFLKENGDEGPETCMVFQECQFQSLDMGVQETADLAAAFAYAHLPAGQHAISKAAKKAKAVTPNKKRKHISKGTPPKSACQKKAAGKQQLKRNTHSKAYHSVLKQALKVGMGKEAGLVLARAAGRKAVADLCL